MSRIEDATCPPKLVTRELIPLLKRIRDDGEKRLRAVEMP